MAKGIIEVPVYFTPTGERTCSLDINKKQYCEFYRTMRMGLEDTCVFAPPTLHGGDTPLERRQGDDGQYTGYLIPGSWCPLTLVEEG